MVLMSWKRSGLFLIESNKFCCIACDASVHSDVTFNLEDCNEFDSNIQEIMNATKGGGGTDFRPH